MTHWTDGYLADFDYTTELNPARLRLAFLNVGLPFPEVGTACELSFGQGVTINLHAAASLSQWFGCDNHPSHVQFAQQLNNAAGSNAQLFNQSLVEFCQRTDLPDFDYIALHGNTWNTLNVQERPLIVDFLRRKLKVGGVLSIRYDTQYAWATILPIRDLLAQQTDSTSALSFIEQLMATNPSDSHADSDTLTRLKKLTAHNHNHNYLQANWQALSFAQTNQYLNEAKLSFACSAEYLDHVDSLNLTDAQQDFLATISDNTLRESVQDFCTHQALRRDYWLKGAVQLTPLEQIESLRTQRLILVQPRADVSYKVSGHLGESALYEGIYSPILNALSNHQATSLGQLEQAIANTGIFFEQMLQAVMVLIGAGVLVPAQDDSVIAATKVCTDKLNYHLCLKARSSEQLRHLASPVTGGGILVSRVSQLFLLARTQGYTQPEQWAQFVWSILAAQNQLQIKDGATLTSANDNLMELLRQAQIFLNKQLPILIALAICE